MYDITSSKSQIDSEVSKIVNNFFDQLELHSYLKEADPLRSLAGIAVRNQKLLRIFDILGVDIENSSSELLKFVKERGLNDYDYYVLYYTLVVHIWLDQIELMKSIILTILTKKAKDECSISGKETFGELLNKLQRKITTGSVIEDFRRLADVDFRNVLGHAKWWIQKENFCYEDKDGNNHFLEKHEFLFKHVQFVALTVSFGNALQSYFVLGQK